MKKHEKKKNKMDYLQLTTCHLPITYLQLTTCHLPHCVSLVSIFWDTLGMFLE